MILLQPVREHFAHHRLHMAGCALACVGLVVAATLFGLPILAALGALMCGAMMIGMIWMMARHGEHHH
jgi:hypothetical protein